MFTPSRIGLHPIDRRRFVQLSAAAALMAPAHGLLSQTAAPAPEVLGDTIRVTGSEYIWSCERARDRFELRDKQDRLITSGPLQPVIVTASGGNDALHEASPGMLTAVHPDSGSVRFEYEGVNHGARLSMRWRFDSQDIWIEPLTYRSPRQEDIVRLFYFAEAHNGAPSPGLDASFFYVPGLCDCSAVSPVVSGLDHLDTTVWLGRGGSSPGPFQQWGLPVHYFCGFSVHAVDRGTRGEYDAGRSSAFTCGLADLPGGDLFMHIRGAQTSPCIEYRSDLWKYLRGPGNLTLGCTWLWAFGETAYESIARYFEGLVRAGVALEKSDSPSKTKTALTPQFCTWGSQVARGKCGDHLDEAFLRQLHAELRNSGMNAGLFSIDNKWEGQYGTLEHSHERFPHFEEFLAGLRKDGFRIGLWTALLRCEHPSVLGLTWDHMLRARDGTPIALGGDAPYYFMDITQPRVEQVARELVRRFVRRYKPDLVKFDFGYELPPLSRCMPHDPSLAGEKLLWKALDALIPVMQEEKPDLVVMYYQLSPLFTRYFDLHSPDDLFLNAGEYDVEANRRFFFSSLLGRLGIPTYGSSGYSWETAAAIWFDSAAVGTLGSLLDFQKDEEGASVTPDLVAKFNGLTHLLRSSVRFRVIPLGNVEQAATRGAHARSWARLENGRLVLLARRPPASGEAGDGRNRPSGGMEETVLSEFPVVVASLDSESIVRTRAMGVVPYDSGQLRIRRSGPEGARILNHYLGGASTEFHVPARGGFWTLSVSDRSAGGAPLEWMEVRTT